MQGYDHLVLYGEASAWTLLELSGGEVRFHDAAPYLGMDNTNFTQTIEKDFDCSERINMAMALFENGALERHGVELIGANAEAIRTAEDRQLFKEAMNRIGVEVPRSANAETVDDAENFSIEANHRGADHRPNRERGDRLAGTELRVARRIRREDRLF